MILTPTPTKRCCMVFKNDNRWHLLLVWGQNTWQNRHKNQSGCESIFFKLGVVAYSFYSSTTEAEAGRSLGVQGQPCLHIKLQASQGYHQGHQSSLKAKEQRLPLEVQN